MKKYILIALALGTVVGFLSVHKALAGGNGEIRLLYPNTSNVYWVKGKTYDVTFYSKNWSQIYWTLNCDGSIPLLSVFNITGDTTVETLQRMPLTIASNSGVSSNCHIRLSNGTSDVRYVNYDTNDIAFSIVDPVTSQGRLQITNVSNLKSSYQPGEQISVSFQVLKPDGTYATPNDTDISAAALISYANPSPSGASGPGIGGVATFDWTNKMWKWSYAGILANDNYRLVIQSWCSLIGGRCQWLYGDGLLSQAEVSFPFTVAPVQNVPWKLTVWDKTTGANLSNTSQNQQVRTGDTLWFVVEGPALQWYRYCFKLNGANYSCDSTFSAYQTDAQGRNDWLQVIAGVGQSTGNFDASVYGDGFSSNHVYYSVSSFYTPTPTPWPTPTYTPTPNCSVWPRREIIDPNKIYTLGEICDGDLIRAQGDIAVYIVKIKNNSYYMRRFFGPQLFKAYGHLSFAKVKNITPETLQHFISSIYLKLDGNATIYGLSDIVPGKSARLNYVLGTVDDDSVFIVNNAEFNLYR